MPLDTWEWVFGVNLWGVIHGIRSFVPLLMQQPEAHVVNTASVAGLVAGAVHGAVQREQARGGRALRDAAPRARDDGAAREGVGAVPGLGAARSIAESARNRPDADLHEARRRDAGDGAELLQPLHRQRACRPTSVAAKVLDAIRAEQFWVLPHDDAEEFWVDVRERRARSRSIDRTNPTLRCPL